MPRGTTLTKDERTKIQAYNDAGKSARFIAKKLGRSPNTIACFLHSPDTYNTTIRHGRKPKLNQRALRRLVQEASKGRTTAKRIKFEQQVPLGVRRIQQLLRGTSHLRWEMRKSSPWMSRGHEIARVKWASKQLSESRDWKSVVFSDEKKFNLDGPDGIQYYWRDLRREPQYFKKRQSGGGSVMVWAAFSGRGKTKLAFLEGKQDAVKYCCTLETFLLPKGREIGGSGWVFQQDNASIHTAAATKRWFSANRVRVLPWPARSPDLNPVENIWGYLVRKVYPDGRCYDSVADLKRAVEKSWRYLPKSYLDGLLKSMNKRCVEVVAKKGRVIDY